MRRGPLILLWLCACDSGSTSAPAASVPPPGTIPPAIACSGKSIPPNDQVTTLQSGGLTRMYRVHVPPSYDPSFATPVVLNFHGYVEAAEAQIVLTDMNPHADANGYIVVYPSGTGLVPSWNAGACCGDAMNFHVDDIGFIRAMIARLETDLCVDTHRIYATGFSNGGMISHRLACEMSDIIAAVAPVAGTLVTEPCNPTRPMPVMHFHGTADPLVPFGGNPALGMPPVVQMMQTWAERDRCAQETQTMYLAGDSSCARYPGCAGGAEVVLCIVDGGGHTWPGGFQVPELGKTSIDLDATAMMWDFFTRHPL
jgi:polyhydroxybutyrate depolymerase